MQRLSSEAYQALMDRGLKSGFEPVGPMLPAMAPMESPEPDGRAGEDEPVN